MTLIIKLKQENIPIGFLLFDTLWVNSSYLAVYLM